MKRKSVLAAAAFAAAAVAGLAGCASSASPGPNEASPAAAAQSPSPMQRASGVYAGELPCADCPGIRTTLYLRASGVYTRISEYVDRGSFEEGGSWTIDGASLIRMTPAAPGASPSLARAEEGAVRLLNADAEAVEGPLADFYLLKKDK